MLLLARLSIATAAVAAVASLPVASAREGGVPRGGGRRQTLSERGTDKLPLGHSLAAVRRLGFIGRLRAGCELASPRPYVAPLRLPLIGSATFNGRKPTS